MKSVGGQATHSERFEAIKKGGDARRVRSWSMMASVRARRAR